jgi:TolB-like protein
VAEGDGLDQVNGAQTPAPETQLVPTSASAVFISYASQDKMVADAMCAALERERVACWIAPRNVRPGDFYAEAIVNAINACPVLALVLSKHSVDSAHVLREVERASAKKRPVIAFRIDASPLPPGLEYFLSASQWIDSSGDRADRHFPKLIGAIHNRIASAPSGDLNPLLADRRPTKQKLNRLVAAVAVAIVLGLVYFVADKFWLSSHAKTERGAAPAASGAGAITPGATAVSGKSIAVLPFTDMSEKHDQEYFADGIAEEVLDRLAKVPGLRVVGRASSFQFKSKGASPASVGAALGVAYLLEGSVRKQAGRVRVAAQLVEARTGSERWSDRFDSDVVDVLQVQDTIALELARALQITVEVDTTPRASVNSPETLDAYLRGRQSYDRFTQEGLEAAVVNFQQALTLDPTFAPAAIGLAKAYVWIGEEAWSPPRVAFEQARQAALLAQHLDPKSASAHVSMAEVHMMYDWDWDGADRELRQAFALGPRGAYGAYVASELAASRGHWDEARQLATEAIALDPLDAEAQESIGFQVYLRSGRLAEAEEVFRRALQISPKYGNGHYFLGEVLMLQGRYESALAEFRKETLDDGQLEGSAMVHFAAGRKVDSDAQLAAAIRQNATTWASEIARVYAFRGEKDRAFEWLDRAYEARDEDLYFIKGDPLLKSLEKDPRYKAFLRRMNLPE